MGAYRYYLAPEGLVDLSEIPPKWGLVEVNRRGHLKVRAGHVLLGYQDPDCWRHDEFDHAAEIGTLAMCLNRVGDPQKLQDMLREANNRNTRLQRKLEQLEKRNRELVQRVLCAQEGIDA